jgi:hypothetical protein
MKKAKCNEKKVPGEVKTKRLMFTPIVYATNEESAADGIVPDPALKEEDGIGCEAVFEDDKKTSEKKNDSEVKPKRLMFAPIVFDSIEDARKHGFVPDPAITDEDVKGCEAVFENNEE